MEAESREGSLPSEAIRQLLEEAIDGALPKPKEGCSPRLVILIDDLDRCEPETALRLLDGTKVYLNLGNCVTVLGMDQRQIERALARALHLGDPDDHGSGTTPASTWRRSARTCSTPRIRAWR